MVAVSVCRALKRATSSDLLFCQVTWGGKKRKDADRYNGQTQGQLRRLVRRKDAIYAEGILMRVAPDMFSLPCVVEMCLKEARMVCLLSLFPRPAPPLFMPLGSLHTHDSHCDNVSSRQGGYAMLCRRDIRACALLRARADTRRCHLLGQP